MQLCSRSALASLLAKTVAPHAQLPHATQAASVLNVSLRHHTGPPALLLLLLVLLLPPPCPSEKAHACPICCC